VNFGTNHGKVTLIYSIEFKAFITKITASFVSQYNCSYVFEKPCSRSSKKFTGFNNPMAYNEKLKAITIYSSSEM
jgi:hypothetical protein